MSLTLAIADGMFGLTRRCVPQLTRMRFFPLLMSEEQDELVSDIPSPRGPIASGSRVVDQIVHPTPFFRAEISHRGLVSIDILRLQIVIIVIRKTKGESRARQ